MNCLHRVIVYDNFYIPCIYRNWFSKEVDADIKTVSILTRKANAFFQEIDNKHLMMPVILKEDKVQSYLSGKTSLDEYYNDEYFDKLEFMKSRR
jgi:putative SOS response-associated peptidase YedK